MRTYSRSGIGKLVRLLLILREDIRGGYFALGLIVRRHVIHKSYVSYFTDCIAFVFLINSRSFRVVKIR
jgi:hypothetical protein